MFRGVYWLVVLIAVAWIGWQLRDFLGEWWRSLWPNRSTESAAADEEPEAAETVRPFSDYRNPYLADGSTRMNPSELIRYTFAAVESWAREQGRPRHAHQTPAEFARTVVGAKHPLYEHLATLADLYNDLAYGSQRAPAHTVKQLRPLWQHLQS